MIAFADVEAGEDKKDMMERKLTFDYTGADNEQCISFRNPSK